MVTLQAGSLWILQLDREFPCGVHPLLLIPTGMRGALGVCFSCFIVPPQCGGVSLWDRASREKGNSSCHFQYSEVGAQSQAGALVHSCGIYRHPGELMSNQPLSCRELLLTIILQL